MSNLKRKLDSDSTHRSLEQRQRNPNDYFKRQRSCIRLHYNLTGIRPIQMQCNFETNILLSLIVEIEKEQY